MTDLHNLDQQMKEKLENIRMVKLASGINKIEKLCVEGVLTREQQGIINYRLLQSEKINDIQIFEGEGMLTKFIEEATNKHVTRIGLKPFDAFETYRVTTLLGVYQPTTKKIKSFVYMNHNGVMCTEEVQSTHSCNDDIPVFKNEVIICELNIQIATRPNDKVEWFTPADTVSTCNHLLMYVPTEKGENE